MPPLEAAVSRRIAGPCEEHRAPARRCDILDALNYFRSRREAEYVLNLWMACLLCGLVFNIIEDQPAEKV